MTPAPTPLVDVLNFKITDITAECTIPYSASYLANAYFAIERGVMVAGTPVTIRTIYYVITSMITGPKGITLQGHILPPSFSSFNGCIWYMDVLDKLVGLNGWTMDQTVTYEDPAAAWLSYLFYPAGRNLTLANMQTFFNVLAQKYMIYPAENMDGLFIFQATTAKAKDYDIIDELLHHETVTTARRLMWRDQFMTVHYSGSSNNPIHNLGYIDGIQGAVPTNTPSPKPFKSSKLPVHLKYRTGDVVEDRHGLQLLSRSHKGHRDIRPEEQPLLALHPRTFMLVHQYRRRSHAEHHRSRRTLHAAAHRLFQRRPFQRRQ